MTLDFIKELLSSTKLRIKSPLLSAFAFFWLIFNWDRLTLLFWSDSSIDNRVNYYLNTGSIIFGFIAPWSAAFLYVILSPLVHRKIYDLNAQNEEKHHASWAKLECTKEYQKTAVEKARLKNDSSQDYLRRLVELEIKEQEYHVDKVKLETEQAQLLRDREILENITAKDRLDEQSSAKLKAEAEQKVVEEIAKKEQIERLLIESEISRKIESDKIISEENAQKHIAKINQLRLPLLLQLVLNLDEEIISGYDIQVSSAKLCEIVAESLGFYSYKSLLDDKKFVSESFYQAKYITYDYRKFSKNIEELFGKKHKSDDYPSIIIESLDRTYKNFEIQFSELDDLAEKIHDNLISSDEILETPEVSSAIYSTNAQFTEKPYLEVESVNFDSLAGKLSIIMKGHLTGEVDNDRMYCGHEINLTVLVEFNSLFGSSVFGEYELTVLASVVDYDESFLE